MRPSLTSVSARLRPAAHVLQVLLLAWLTLFAPAKGGEFTGVRALVERMIIGRHGHEAPRTPEEMKARVKRLSQRLDVKFSNCRWAVFMYEAQDFVTGGPYGTIMRWTIPGNLRGALTNVPGGTLTEPANELAETGGGMVHRVVIFGHVWEVALLFVSSDEPPMSAFPDEVVEAYKEGLTTGLTHCVRILTSITSHPLNLSLLATCMGTQVQHKTRNPLNPEQRFARPRSLVVATGPVYFGSDHGGVYFGIASGSISVDTDLGVIRGPDLHYVVLPPY